MGNRSSTILEILTTIEDNSKNKLNKNNGTMFEDVIEYLLSNKCIKHPLLKNYKYQKLYTNSKGLDGIIHTNNRQIGVQIKFSCNINKNLTNIKKQFQPCIDVCHEKNIDTLIIITNRIRISKSLYDNFLANSICLYGITREHLLAIDSKHINNIKNIPTVKSYCKTSSWCNIL